MEVTGVYPGLLAIAVGIDNLTQRDLALDDASNLVLLGYGNALSSGTLEVILAKVSTSGVLDRSFNPSGLAISSTGAEISGGYSGIKIVQPSPSGISLAKAVAVGPNNRILVGAFGVRGGEKEAETAFVYVVLNEDGSADQTFNPSGLNIDVAGQLVSNGLGYPGVLYDETGFVVTPHAMLYDSNNDVYVLAGFGVGVSSTAIAGGGFISSVSTTGANDTTFNPDSFAALRPFLVSGRQGLTALSTTLPVALLSDIILDSKGRYIV